MSQHDIGDVSSPPPLFDVIRIIPGAIVYCKSQFSSGSKTAQSLFIDRYLDFRFFFIFTRETTYKVVRMRHEAGICLCDLTPFPPSQSIPDLTKPLAELALIEMNRGKAGALNFCNEYFRCKTIDWATKLQISPHIQTLVGIIDARHALVEPHIFWNDALPFFSSQKNTLAHSRSYGFKKSSQYPVCITVQYPQHFSNVGHDDYLDNANSAYYNIWQPLRDCGKCVTSSGTNTIWFDKIL